MHAALMHATLLAASCRNPEKLLSPFNSADDFHRIPVPHSRPSYPQLEIPGLHLTLHKTFSAGSLSDPGTHPILGIFAPAPYHFSSTGPFAPVSSTP